MVASDVEHPEDVRGELGSSGRLDFGIGRASACAPVPPAGGGATVPLPFRSRYETAVFPAARWSARMDDGRVGEAGTRPPGPPDSAASGSRSRGRARAWTRRDDGQRGVALS